MEHHNEQLINDFYTAFANGDANGMIACYDDNVTFKDPVFGKLENGRPAKMWEMLLSRKKNTTKVVFDTIEANESMGSANWTATYEYGPKNRKVVNNVTANFKFKDGKIIEHVDTFDLWKWTKQALGFSGVLLGWSSFMKNKIQQTTNKQLNEYINKTE